MLFPFTVVTIFLGIRLDGAGLDDSALYAMIAYCVAVLVVIVFDVYLSMKKNSRATFITTNGEKGGELKIINNLSFVWNLVK